VTDHLDQTSDTPSNLRLRECSRCRQMCDTGRDGAIVPHYWPDDGRRCGPSALAEPLRTRRAEREAASFDYTAHRLRAFSRSSD